jgi:hypothetical protein
VPDPLYDPLAPENRQYLTRQAKALAGMVPAAIPLGRGVTALPDGSKLFDWTVDTPPPLWPKTRVYIGGKEFHGLVTRCKTGKQGWIEYQVDEDSQPVEEVLDKKTGKVETFDQHAARRVPFGWGGGAVLLNVVTKDERGKIILDRRGKPVHRYESRIRMKKVEGHVIVTEQRGAT